MAMGYELTQGMKVRSSDGESLGKIIRVEPDRFVVEKGFFFPKDYAIPVSLVRECREGECWLSASKAELERDREAIGAGSHGSDWERDTSVAAMESDRPAQGQGDTQRLTLSEEELEARKRVHEAGEVSVHKEVVTEHRQIDVPVMREEVHVERTPATSATPAQGAFEEQTIRVPVREEEIEVTKRPRVREEVRVTRTARQTEQRVEGDVRREEARIDRTDEPDRGRTDEPDRGAGPGAGTGPARGMNDPDDVER